MTAKHIRTIDNQKRVSGDFTNLHATSGGTDLHTADTFKAINPA